MTRTFTFYPTFSIDDIGMCMPQVPALLPASSWARRNLATPRIPDHVTDRAADCGGFVATRIWGDYRYTPAQYVDWLGRWTPTWAATMDYCCEDEITSGKPGIVKERQERTTEKAYHFWQEYRRVPWSWVPTIQGWFPDDYKWHARTLRPLLEEMQAHYGIGSTWRVGVGTLCQRASVQMIDAVLAVVRDELPEMPLHLWGVKLAALKVIDLTNIVSSDSAAWHGMFGNDYRSVLQQAHARGMTRREYILQFNLPTYIEKVVVATARVPEVVTLDTSLIEQVLKVYGWSWCVRQRGRKAYAYARRRINGKIKEYCLAPLNDIPLMSPATILAKVCGKDAGLEVCHTLWSELHSEL